MHIIYTHNHEYYWNVDLAACSTVCYISTKYLKILSRDIAASFCQLIAALEISPHGKGLAGIHSKSLIASSLKLCTWMSVDRCRHLPQNLATLKLSPHQIWPWNKISPWQDFKETQYVMTAKSRHKPNKLLFKATTIQGITNICFSASTWHVYHICSNRSYTPSSVKEIVVTLVDMHMQELN